MYPQIPQHGAPMAPPQKPETFMLSNEAQQSLPHDAQVQLQQVDNCKMRSLACPVWRLANRPSEILPSFGASGLAARPAYPEIPSPNW